MSSRSSLEIIIPEACVVIFLGNPSKYNETSYKSESLSSLSMMFLNSALFLYTSLSFELSSIYLFNLSVFSCGILRIFETSSRTALALSVPIAIIPATFFSPYFYWVPVIPIFT